jgi:hypothetical protein
LEIRGEQQEVQLVVVVCGRVQTIYDVRLEHREREREEELGVRPRVWDDVANHVLLVVGVLDGCRILHLDLVKLLEH